MSLENFSNKDNNAENTFFSPEKNKEKIIKFNLSQKYKDPEPIIERFKEKGYPGSLESLKRLNNGIIKMVEGYFNNKEINKNIA